MGRASATPSYLPGDRERKPARPSWLVAVVAISLICACSSQTAPSPSASAAASVGPLGGTLVVGMDLADYEKFQRNEDRTVNGVWDPQLTWAAEPFELFRCCLLRTLMSYNGRSTSEGGAELRPDLAADVPTISADGRTWTFRLKTGLHYGPPFTTTPITSRDFVRALERALKPDPSGSSGAEARTFGPYAYYFAEVIVGADDFTKGRAPSISGLETPDDQTLVIQLIRPAGDLGARLAMPAAAPIPPGAADGHDAGYGRYLVSSGPYMIEGADQMNPTLPPDQQPTPAGYVPGQKLSLVRNPGWDRASDPLRAALADRIDVVQTAGYNPELAAILDGTIDVALADDLDVPDIERFQADNVTAPRLHQTPALRSRWITINIAARPFDDIHVRRAVQFVTDKQKLLRAFGPNKGIQSHAIPDPFENGLLTDYDPYPTPDHAGSLDRAKAEMALSAYDTDHDGRCDATVCRDIYVPISDGAPQLAEAAKAFAAMLAQIGLTLRIEPLADDEAFIYTHDPANHAQIGFTLGWASEYLNGSSWFGPLATSSAIKSEIGANLSLIGASPQDLASWGYDVTVVPSLDAKIESCVALTGAAQFACWAETDQYLMERIAAWVPIETQQASRITSASVTEFVFDASYAMPALEQIAVSRR